MVANGLGVWEIVAVPETVPAQPLASLTDCNEYCTPVGPDVIPKYGFVVIPVIVFKVVLW